MCEKCFSDVYSSYAQAFTNNMQQYDTAKTLTVSKMLFLLLIIQYPIHIVSYSHSVLFVLL